MPGTAQEIALGTRIHTLLVDAGFGGGGAPLADTAVSGTVKTDVHEADPLVYTKASVDSGFYTKTAADARYAPIAHSHAGTDITSGLIAAARLGSGSGGATKFLREDQSWQAVAGGAASMATLTDVVLTALADAQLIRWDAATSKFINFTGSGTYALVATTLAGYGITDAYTKTASDALYALVAHTHTFASLTSKPTTIAGYGITDFNSLGDARWSLLGHTHTFASITAPPTTLAGYGITDAYTKTASDALYALVAHTHTFASLTSKPTTIAGYGITDFNSLGDARWALIATTLAGYGITDAYTKTAADARYAAIVHTHVTTDVTSGRFIAARHLDGLNGLVLMGKGAGVDPAYSSLVTVRLTADNAAIAAAAPTTALQVANLTLAALVNEEWDIEWILDIVNSVAADVYVFNVTSTAGTLTGRYEVDGASGVPGAGAAVVKRLVNPVGTLTTATANAPGATGTIGLATTVKVRARVKLTVANGTIQLLLRAGTNAAASSGTAVVKAQSQMTATRIA